MNANNNSIAIAMHNVLYYILGLLLCTKRTIKGDIYMYVRFIACMYVMCDNGFL